MLDLNTGESRCFGFVKFKTREQANRALQAMNGQKLGNKTLVVKFADTTNDSIGTPSNNIYVKNLSPTMSLQELEGLFSAYGKIQECKVLKGSVCMFHNFVIVFFFFFLRRISPPLF